MNFAQKIRSPIQIAFTKEPTFWVFDEQAYVAWGPCSLIITITVTTAFLVPATTPSSIYHLWYNKWDASSSEAMVATNLCRTKPKFEEGRTPVSEDMVPMG